MSLRGCWPLRRAYLDRDGFNRAGAGAFAPRLAWSLVFVAMVPALLWPALANRFPLVFYDTGGYLVPVFEQELHLGRSALYGAFLALGIPLDFWPNVVIQAALAGWVVILTLRAHGFGRRPAGVLVVVLALAAVTSLPWYAAQLMPDVLVPTAVLALYLVALRRRALRRVETVLLCAVVAFAVASHMGTLGLMLALLALILALRLVGARLAQPCVTAPAAAIVAGIALALLSNLATTGRFAFTPGGTTIAFTRLVDDGIVKRYLDAKCPTSVIRLCAFRDDLPEGRGEWLWNDDGPLAKLGGWQNYEDEARRVILDSLAVFPGLHLKSVLSNTLEQFVRAATGDGLVGWMWHTLWAMERYAPQVYPHFIAARQQTEEFDFSWLNAVHVPVFLVSLAALPILVGLSGNRVRRPAAALALFVFFAFLGNAAICGAVASAYDRYQSRLAALAPLAVAIAALGWRRRSRRFSPSRHHAEGYPYRGENPGPGTDV
ncbi:MAG: hypothetical protein WAU59_11215 [Rhodoplanes sp.]